MYILELEHTNDKMKRIIKWFRTRAFPTLFRASVDLQERRKLFPRSLALLISSLIWLLEMGQIRVYFHDIYDDSINRHFCTLGRKKN